MIHGAGYEQTMQRIINANPIVAAKALAIVRAGGDTHAAIQKQIAAWNGVDGEPTEVIEQALTALVDYFAETP